MVDLQRTARLAVASVWLFQTMLIAVAQEGGVPTKKMAVPGAALPAFQQRVVPYASEPFFVTYVIADLRKSRLRVAMPDDLGGGGASLERLLIDTGALAIVSGSFLESYTPALPAGLVISKRRVLNRAKADDPVLSGVICFDTRRRTTAVEIMPFDPGVRGSEKYERYDECLQVGPLLFLERNIVADLGKIDANRKSRNHASRAVERSFFGKLDHDRVIFGESSPVSLRELSEFCLRPEQRGGLGLSDLIGLASRDSAGLIVNGHERLIAGTTNVLIPTAIIATE
jgi:hypothetical protein